MRYRMKKRRGAVRRAPTRGSADARPFAQILADNHCRLPAGSSRFSASFSSKRGLVNTKSTQFLPAHSLKAAVPLGSGTTARVSSEPWDGCHRASAGSEPPAPRPQGCEHTLCREGSMTAREQSFPCQSNPAEEGSISKRKPKKQGSRSPERIALLLDFRQCLARERAPARRSEQGPKGTIGLAGYAVVLATVLWNTLVSSSGASTRAPSLLIRTGISSFDTPESIARPK